MAETALAIVAGSPKVAIRERRQLFQAWDLQGIHLTE